MLCFAHGPRVRPFGASGRVALGGFEAAARARGGARFATARSTLRASWAWGRSRPVVEADIRAEARRLAGADLHQRCRYGRI